VTATTFDPALESTLERVYAAWNANDVNAFVAPYAEFATATLPGIRLTSREAVRETMSSAFAGPLEGSHVCYEVQSVRRIAEHAALVTARSGFVLRGEAEPTPEHVVLATWVLSDRDGSWSIEAYHECAAGLA
jgi:uncharacterized protein (TIGR02246 family)